MPKAVNGFDLERYAPVARRITLFYERYPGGRIITALVQRDARSVIFCARVYRAAEDAKPAATGWALEREGDGDVNAVACLENTETSAIGRALANLGFTASAERPSREEMQRVARARQAPLRVSAPRPRGAPPVPAFSPLLQSHADALSDALALLALARQAGMRPARAARTSARLLAHPPAREELTRIASRLRAWLHRQRQLSAVVV
jgi:hypothetical protein